MIDLRKALGTPKAVKVTAAALTARGAEILAPTNPYEVIRFRTCYGVGVVYRNAAGRLNPNDEATQALGVLWGQTNKALQINREAHERARRALLQTAEIA